MRNSQRSVAVVQFKRWKNLACAVFNSLGKEVKVGVLLITYMVSCPSTGVFAEEPQKNPLVKDDEVALEEVVVSAQRSTATYSDIARVVSVITKTEIEQAGVQSINELLEFALNVDVRQRGQHGVQADITIRGGSFDQVLVLLNGVNVSDPQTGHLSLNLPVSLDAIERVEIISGSASRIYGPNAFTGAVNFITGSYEENVAIAKLEVGEHGLWNGNLTTTLQKEKSRHLLSLGYKTSDGYIDNSDFKVMNAFYQGQFQANKAKYDVQLGSTSREFGANTFYTAKFPNQFENVQTNFVSAKATFEGKVKFTPTVYYRRQTDRFELFRDKIDAPSWYTKHNHHVTDVYGVNLNTSFDWSLGKTAIGGEFRSENILSNNMGKARSKKRVHGQANAYYNKEDDRNNVSLFLEHTLQLWEDRFTATAGVMANYNDAFDDKLSWFPGIDVSMKLDENWKLYATANKALRLPTFTDLYYQTSTHSGNIDLVPEEATSYETGIKYSNRGFHAHAAYFFRAGENLIDWTKEKVTDDKWVSENLTDVDIYGVETSIKLRPFLWNDNLEFLRSLTLNYSFTEVDNVESQRISAYVMDHLKHKFDGEFTVGVLENLFLTTHASWQDRAGSFGYYASPSAKPVEKEYDPFWLLNSRLTWKKDNYELYVQGSNLLDNEHYDIGNVIQPGRWVTAGAKIKLYW